MKLRPIQLVLAMGISASVPAYADDVSDLKAQIQILSERLSNVEKERAQATPASPGPKGPAPVTIAFPPSMQLISGDDNSVSIYGVLDVTFATQNHADKAGNRGTAPVVSWMSGNRLGFDAWHLLDRQSGLKVIGRLENEFELPTGNLDTPNVLFNRDAWVGLQSDSIGKITLGRQNTLPRDFAQTWGEAFGSREVGLDEGGWSNNAQQNRLIDYASGAVGSRYNSAVVWKKKTDNWVYGLAHEFNGGGGYAPGQFSTGTTTAGAVAYNGGRFNVNATLTRSNVADFTHQSFGIGGNFQIAPEFLVRGGYFNGSVDQAAVGKRKDDVWTASFMYAPKALANTEFDIGYFTVNARNAGFAANGNTLGFMKDTSQVTSAADGKMNTFYAAAFYKWDRQTDVYFNMDMLRTSGGYHTSFTNGFASATEAGVGLRFKF